MDEATYGRMPAQLTVREIRFKVERPGFRVDELVLVTTMVDGQRYSKEELADLFLERWNIEVCQADYIPRGGLYPSARWAHSERGGAAAPGLLVPGASSRHRRTDAMRSDSERPAPPRPRAA
jgi:hypothetical protein